MTIVSVIIPCFNRSNLIERAVASVKKDFTGAEIIVVDDGSEDGSWEVIQRLSGVRMRRIEHAGASAARNAGLRLATTEWVRFLDSDDELVPGSTEVLLKAEELLPPRTIPIGMADDSSYGFHNLEAGSIITGERVFGSTIPLGLGLWPRSRILDVGGFNERIVIGEDQELAARLYKDGFTFTQVRSTVYSVGHSESNRVTRQASESKFDQHLTTISYLAMLAATPGEKKALGRLAWAYGREASRLQFRKQAEKLFQFGRDIAGDDAVYGPTALTALYRLCQPYTAEQVLASIKRVLSR